MDAETRAVIGEFRHGLLVELGEQVPAGLEIADQDLDLDKRLHGRDLAGRQSGAEFVDEIQHPVVRGDAVVDRHVAVGVLRDGALADAEHVGDLALREASLSEITGEQRADGRKELVYDDFFDELHSLPDGTAGDGITCGSRLERINGGTARSRGRSYRNGRDADTAICDALDGDGGDHRRELVGEDVVEQDVGDDAEEETQNPRAGGDAAHAGVWRLTEFRGRVTQPEDQA